MKKYIFPIGVLIFVAALAMLITHFTQGSKPEPKIMEGWKHISFDQTGNSYYIDPQSIVNDGETDDELLFHATFYKIYSEKGRNEFIKSYNVDENIFAKVDHEIDVMYFRDLDGIKFVTAADCKFFDVNENEIPELKINVKFDEKNKPIPGKSIGENLYDYAYQRVKKN